MASTNIKVALPLSVL